MILKGLRTQDFQEYANRTMIAGTAVPTIIVVTIVPTINAATKILLEAVPPTLFGTVLELLFKQLLLEQQLRKLS